MPEVGHSSRLVQGFGFMQFATLLVIVYILLVSLLYKRTRFLLCYEASSQSCWRETMVEELQALERKKSYQGVSLVPLLNERVIDLKQVGVQGKA